MIVHPQLVDQLVINQNYPLTCVLVQKELCQHLFHIAGKTAYISRVGVVDVYAVMYLTAVTLSLNKKELYCIIKWELRT